MTFYIVVGLMIVSFSVIYVGSRNQVVLFGIGFMSGMFVAKILTGI